MGLLHPIALGLASPALEIQLRKIDDQWAEEKFACALMVRFNREDRENQQ